MRAFALMQRFGVMQPFGLMQAYTRGDANRRRLVFLS